MIYDNPSATPPTYECLYQEADRQKVPPELLLAIMKTEAGRLGQFQKNKNGTFDVGPMQINTSWIPKLAKKVNSTPEKVTYTLAFHGCWNLAVAAWILRDAINEATIKSKSRNTTDAHIWQGVAWYNSHTPKYGNAYAWRVHRNLQQILFASKNQTFKVGNSPAVEPIVALKGIAQASNINSKTMTEPMVLAQSSN